MNPKDEKEFSMVMVGLAENFSAALSGPGIHMRFEALRDYPIDKIKSAAMSIIRARVFTKMPTVAEFIEHIDGSASDISEIEALKVVDAIKSNGAYKTVVFDDEVTMSVIRQRFGGWSKLCLELNDDEIKWFINEFKTTYIAFRNRGVKSGGKLIGISESEHRAKNYLDLIDQPILIGNQEKALAISHDQEGVGLIAADIKKLTDKIGG